MKHLLTAVERYEQWGAMSKAADLEQFIAEAWEIRDGE